MRRFFVSPEDIKGEQVEIKDNDAHHLIQVLRLKTGEEVQVFTGTGLEYLVRITDVSPGLVVGEIIGISSSTRDSKINVTLVQGIPKGDKMELIIQKCTELGITKIVPILAERTIVKLEDSKKEKRRERWQKIAQEASKQCQRSTVPEVGTISNWGEYLAARDNSEQMLVLWENEENQGIKNYLKQNKELDQITLVIGPEGGLTTKEIEKLVEAGASTASLGPRILRTETAGIAALTMVLYELGDLG